jgi:hypothetical protein
LTNDFQACFNSDVDVNKIIDDLGGTNAVAELCKVSPQAVSQWRDDGIPPARLMFLKVVRPDVFESDPSATERAA